MAKKTQKRQDPRIRQDRKKDLSEGRTSNQYQDSTAVQVPPGDIALVVGKNAQGVHILRRRSQESPIEAGLLRPVQEGKPILGEVVSLTAREDLPMVFDVKSEFSPDSSEAEHPDHDRPARPALDGPAQVASDSYRRGWDAVWGSRRRDRSVN